MSGKQKYLLIIDDEPCNNELIDYFAKFDYQIVQITQLSQLDQNKEQPTALLIHHNFVKANPQYMHQLYEEYPAPLIIISSLRNEDHCVAMLEAGADDFLVKPIHPRELHARISAIARRVQRSSHEVEIEKEFLSFANLRLFPASRQVFNEKNQELQLSAGEYELLLAFVKQPQQVLGREFLLQITKNSDLNPFDRRIDVQISRLRQKIEVDAKKPMLIKTIRNGGYLFTAQVLTKKTTEL